MTIRYIRSEIRGSGLKRGGRTAFRALRPQQPLLLVREPDNPVDRNAIELHDLHGAFVGYLAREHAAVVAPQIDKGIMWLGRAGKLPQCYVWTEGEDARVIIRTVIKGRRKETTSELPQHNNCRCVWLEPACNIDDRDL